MAIFSASPGSYQDAINLIDSLKTEGIEAWITAGGVAVQVTPDRVNDAKRICKGSLSPGFTASQEEFMSLDVLEESTNSAIAVLREWQ